MKLTDEEAARLDKGLLIANRPEFKLPFEIKFPDSWNEQDKILASRLPFYVACVNYKHKCSYTLTKKDFEGMESLSFYDFVMKLRQRILNS